MGFYGAEFQSWKSAAWTAGTVELSLRDLGFYTLGFCALVLLRSRHSVALHSTALGTNKLVNSQPRCKLTSREIIGKQNDEDQSRQDKDQCCDVKPHSAGVLFFIAVFYPRPDLLRKICKIRIYEVSQSRNPDREKVPGISS